jgi:hypothetical protein
MGRQIIKQPDGLYAVWSSVVDDFILIDATPEEIIADWVEEEEWRIREKVSKIVAQLDEGGKPYYQFTMSWQEAIETYEAIHHKRFNIDALRREAEQPK